MQKKQEEYLNTRPMIGLGLETRGPRGGEQPPPGSPGLGWPPSPGREAAGPSPGARAGGPVFARGRGGAWGLLRRGEEPREPTAPRNQKGPSGVAVGRGTLNRSEIPTPPSPESAGRGFWLSTYLASPLRVAEAPRGGGGAGAGPALPFRGPPNRPSPSGNRANLNKNGPMRTVKPAF
ncbi:uncharacterized protein LOC131225151 [Magnolia sinica]|uniref:uncharacterized protein LOC131225151 n=1 Tax=Magnolia sinica TaxID=86752 RepID=UPI002658D315|nr:uncharacterized protein LOC131225151 [Magnolia sinica]